MEPSDRAGLVISVSGDIMTQILFQSSAEIPDQDILGSGKGVSRQAGFCPQSKNQQMSWADGLDGCPVQARNLPGSTGSRQH